MNLFICCSANKDIEKKFITDSEKILNKVLKNNDLVFGTCSTGIMGLAYKIAKEHNRKVIGICPTFYKEMFKELECDTEIETKTMLDSTMQIIKNSDAILVLPGGFGTIYETFTAIQSKICEEHQLPIIIYNSCNYYDYLIKMIEEIYKNKFGKEELKEKYYIANTQEEVVNILNKINK